MSTIDAVVGRGFDSNSQLNIKDSSENTIDLFGNQNGYGGSKKLSFDLNFAADDQSMWGTDFQLRDERFLGTSWNVKDSKTVLELPWKLPDLSVYGSTSGRIGLQSDLQLQGGTVDASIPVNVWMDIPDRVRSGETITLKSSFSIKEGAAFSTASPNGSYDLDLIFGAKAEAGVKAGSHTWKPLDLDVAEQRKDLLTLNSNGADKSFPIGDYGSVDLHFPSIATQGHLTGSKTLSAQGSDRFLGGKLDLDKLATTGLRAAGVPVPDLEASEEYKSSKWGFDVNAKFKYNLLDVELAPELNFQQKFELGVDGLTGHLILENGDAIGFKVGEDVTFTVPEGIGDSLEANALLNLDASFNNKTGLGYDVDLDLKALSFSGKVGAKKEIRWFPDLNISREFGVGPVLDKHFDIAKGDITSLYDRTFDLNGFNSQAIDLKIPVAV